MKYTKIFVIVFFVATFFFCKKKSSSDQNNQTNTSTTTGSSATSTSYDGYFGIDRMQTLSNSTLAPAFATNAPSFLASTKLSDTSNLNVNTVYGGQVSVNNVIFQVQNGGSWCSYFDTTYTIFNSPFTWKVAGAGSITGFTTTINQVFPTYTGYNSLPDTVYKKSPLNIFVSSYTNAEEMYISCTTFPTGGFNRYYVLPVSNASIDTAGLSKLKPNVTTDIRITFIKNSFQAFGGKNYKFATSYTIKKAVYIKP